jgi:hypothetical protein
VFSSACRNVSVRKVILMALTRKERQKIYEEERARIKARARIKTELYNRKYSVRIMNWVITGGFLLMLYIVLFDN